MTCCCHHTLANASNIHGELKQNIGEKHRETASPCFAGLASRVMLHDKHESSWINIINSGLPGLQWLCLQVQSQRTTTVLVAAVHAGAVDDSDHPGRHECALFQHNKQGKDGPGLSVWWGTTCCPLPDTRDDPRSPEITRDHPRPRHRDLEIETSHESVWKCGKNILVGSDDSMVDVGVP